MTTIADKLKAGGDFAVADAGQIERAVGGRSVEQDLVVLDGRTTSFSAAVSRSGWIGPRVNDLTGRVLEGQRVGGAYWQSGVSRLSLDPMLARSIPDTLRQRSGWSFLRFNGVTGRVIQGERMGGSSYNKGALAAVAESNLNAPLHQHIFKERTTLRPVRPDLVQTTEQAIGLTTHAAGYPWMRLPRIAGARYLRNQPAGGIPVGLQIRKRLPVRMGGLRRLGDWSPATASAASVHRVGYLSNTTDYGFLNALPASGGYNEGDYLVARPIGGGTIATSAGTAYPGDCIAIHAGAWVLQRAPAGTANPGEVFERDWWTVTGAGTFDGVAYAAGDRIVLHGEAYYHRYRRGRPDQGEMFNRGELDASSGAAPSVPVLGDAWQVTAAGTISGATIGIDDWLLYDGAGFYGVATAAILTAAANRPFLAPLSGDSDEYEVRRADKANAFEVRLLAPSQAAPRTETSAVYALGDSMMHFLAPTLLNAVTDRVIDVEGFDSAGAEEIASIFGHIVLTGDPFAGRTIVAWFGQNGEAQWQEAIDAHLRIGELLAPFDRYYIPVTPAGRREQTWNGVRLVSAWHEPMKLNTDTSNALVMLQQQVARLFGGRYIDARAVVAAAVAANAASFAAPDLQYPGMTEAQACAAYGVLPISLYYDLAGAGLNPAAATYKGTWSSTTALPTGGAAGDYYLQIVSGGGVYVGNIVANIGGAWTDLPTGDRNTVVHFAGPHAAVANTALASAITSFLAARGW